MIDQTPTFTTEAAKALDRAENMKRHKVYNTSYSQPKYGTFKVKEAGRFPSSSTAGNGDGDTSQVVQKEEDTV